MGEDFVQVCISCSWSETLGFSTDKSDWLSWTDQLVWIIIVELLEISFDYKFKVSDLCYLDCVQVTSSCIQVIAVSVQTEKYVSVSIFKLYQWVFMLKNMLVFKFYY